MFTKIDKGGEQNWLITTVTSRVASVVMKTTETRTMPCSIVLFNWPAVFMYHLYHLRELSFPEAWQYFVVVYIPQRGTLHL